MNSIICPGLTQGAAFFFSYVLSVALVLLSRLLSHNLPYRRKAEVSFHVLSKMSVLFVVVVSVVLKNKGNA